MIGARAPFGKAGPRWPFSGWLINSPTSSTARRKAHRNKVGFVSSSGPPLLCSEAPGQRGWQGTASLLALPQALEGHTLVFSLAPQRAPAAFKWLEPCSVPVPEPSSLAMGGKASLLARASWRSRSCVFAVWCVGCLGEREGFEQPTWEHNDGR